MSFRMLIGLWAVSASAQEAWTEAAVVRRFLEQNPLARETRARVAIGEAETRGRTLYSNPSLSVSREGAGRTEITHTCHSTAGASEGQPSHPAAVSDSP